MTEAAVAVAALVTSIATLIAALTATVLALRGRRVAEAAVEASAAAVQEIHVIVNRHNDLLEHRINQLVAALESSGVSVPPRPEASLFPPAPAPVLPSPVMEPVKQPLTTRAFLVDLVERAGSTLVQAAIVYAIATPVVDAAFWRGLVVALVVAGANVVKIALTTWVPPVTGRWTDVAYRTVSTFVVALAGSLVSVSWLELVDVAFWTQVGQAALMAALALVKSVLALRMRTQTITPASLAPVSATLPPPDRPGG